MRRLLLASSVVVLGLGVVAGSVQACPTISLPTATASNTVTFGDAVTYSLPILGIDVASTPGQISDCIVVATGSSGNPVTTNIPGADNAYPTPSGESGSTFFSTGNPATQPAPAAPFTGQTSATWDISATALETFLNGADPVIMFNHNQVNSGDSTNQNLFIWAQVALVNNVTGETQYFYASAEDNPTGLPNFGLPGGDPTLFTGTQPTDTYPLGSDASLQIAGGFCGIPGAPPCGTSAAYMINAQGQICLNGPVGIGTPIPCDGSQGPVVATVNENLGADHASNALVFPELNAILADPNFVAANYTIQVDLRMGCNPETITAINGPQSPQFPGCPAGSSLNNGFEQVFIVAGEVGTTQVPEPSSLALMGTALLGVGWLYRRRRTR